MSKTENNTLVPELRFPGFLKDGKWSLKELHTLGQTISGLNGKSGSDFGSGKPYVTYKQVFDSSTIDFTKCGRVIIDEKENQNTIKKGDILFTTSSETPDEVGFASVILNTPTESTYLNSFCFSFRPFDLKSLMPEFSRYLFHSPFYRDSISILAQGSTRYNISKGAFLNLKLPFPPSPKEQKKIADCLSSLDDLIIVENQKLEALKEHKRGLMQQMFPAEGEKVPKLRFKEFKNSGDWVEKTLGYCLLRNPEYGINAPGVPYSENLPTYLRITDISENGYFLPTQKVSVDKQVNDSNYLEAGDIVLARTGASVGKSYKYRIKDGRLVFAGFLIRVKPDLKKLNSELLFQFFSTSQYWKWVSFMSARSGQPGINSTEYSSMPICLPPGIEEQKKIATCLSSLDELITTQKDRIERLETHTKGLMQQLFPNMAALNA